MRATTRPLFGEEFLCYEIACDATEPSAYAKVLRGAARLVDELEPGSVQLSGIHWRESTDEMIAYLVVGTA